MQQPAAGVQHTALAINAYRVEGTKIADPDRAIKFSDLLRIRMVVMKVRRYENINVEVLRFDQDRQLTIDSLGKVSEGLSAAVVQI